MPTESGARSRRVRSVLVWTGRAVGAVLAPLLLLVLVFFSVLALLRERATRGAAPSTGRFVRASDVDVFLQESGPASGQPVLLMHGTGAWSEIWRETMTALAAGGYRAIAIDVPPFGYSEKPAGAAAYSRERQAQRILGVMDALQLPQAILVGHSVGARPTIEAALAAPQRVQRLILVDPALGFAPDGKGFQQNDPSWAVRTLFRLKPLRFAVLATGGTNPLFIRSLFASFVSKKDAVTPARVEMLKRPMAVAGTTNGYGDWLQVLLVERDGSLASDFSRFRTLPMPVGIIWGSTDTVTPLWQGQRLHELIPHSTLIVLDGVGHIPYIEDAAAFNRELVESLRAQ
jgi:pimeloyl-ACP methyl ester carboxylesterase